MYVIDEQIRFWAQWYKQLEGFYNNYQIVTETSSQILNDCVKEFGRDAVYDKNSFYITEDNCLKIFKILDKHIFESRLKTVQNLKLFIGLPAKLNKIILDYTRGLTIDVDQYLALYQPDFGFIKNPYASTYILIVKKDAIFINIQQHSAISCAYMLSVICHEMIHAYDMHFGKLIRITDALFKQNKTGDEISYLSHFTDIFKQKSNIMKNKTNITIHIAGNDIEIADLSNQAYDEIQSMNETDMSSFIPCKCPKYLADKYKDSDGIYISKDRTSVSITFGQLKPKGY